MIDVVEHLPAHDAVSGRDIDPMDSNEFAPTPSAAGILQCLRLLAREAASLHLFRTLSAIEDALEAAVDESGIDYAGQADAVIPPVLH